jgi:hypothetical protein
MKTFPPNCIDFRNTIVSILCLEAKIATHINGGMDATLHTRALQREFQGHTSNPFHFRGNLQWTPLFLNKKSFYPRDHLFGEV